MDDYTYEQFVLDKQLIIDAVTAQDATGDDLADKTANAEALINNWLYEAIKRSL